MIVRFAEEVGGVYSVLQKVLALGFPVIMLYNPMVLLFGGIIHN